MQNLQYPIGQIVYTDFQAQLKEDYIHTISHFDEHLSEAILDLSEADLGKRYRPGGWSIRQLVHHCADSHMNAYIRFKLALTEDNPTIKPYDEAAWAEMPDSELVVSLSQGILTGVHKRWAEVLKKMERSDYGRTFFHPELKKSMTLWDALAMYDWHCRHHLAHIELAKKN